MTDQADNLRKLVHEESQQSGQKPDIPLVLVCGGQRGVGASTVAVQLALAWKRQKRRTILVDASFRTSSFAAPGRGKRQDTLVDVLSGGRTVAEVLCTGPHGVQVLPGEALPPALADVSAKTWGRVIGQLRSLQSPAEAIVFDVGAGVPANLGPLWQAADYVLLVTGTHPVSVTDTYATLKTASVRLCLPEIGVVTNRVEHDDQSLAAADRIASAARRFLNCELEVIPFIPFASEMAGETPDSSRLHKDPTLRTACDVIAEHLWDAVHKRRQARQQTMVAA